MSKQQHPTHASSTLVPCSSFGRDLWTDGEIGETHMQVKNGFVQEYYEVWGAPRPHTVDLLPLMSLDDEAVSARNTVEHLPVLDPCFEEEDEQGGSTPVYAFTPAAREPAPSERPPRARGSASNQGVKAELISLSQALRPQHDIVATEYKGVDPFEDCTVASRKPIPAASSASSASVQVPSFKPPLEEWEKTTLMIRNLPIKATQQTLLQTWPPNGSYDFLYMPFSFEKHRNLGYAFINFVNHAEAIAFYDKWHGAIPAWPNMKKPFEISWALVQGRDKNLMQFMDYKIARIKNVHYQPAVFDGTKRLCLVNFMSSLRALNK